MSRLTPKKLYAADLESDGLSDVYTKIWVVGLSELDPVTMKEIRSFEVTDYEQIKEYVEDPEITWIFHNGHSFDRPCLEHFISKFAGSLIDTLGLSWYLYPKRQKHGLGPWGEELGISKPSVDDWSEQPLEVYIDRVCEDVKIQAALWRQMWKHLMLLYKDVDLSWKAAYHISSKMYALAVAEQSTWQVNQKDANTLVEMFEEKQGVAKVNLAEGMPMVPVYAKKTRPKKPYKKDGTLSATGVKWKAIVEEYDKDFDYMGEIKVLTGHKEPNPGSHAQVKAWLFDLGWKPTVFDFKRDKETGDVRKIPQVKDSQSGELCEHITKMSEENPALLYLQELGVLSHRASLVKGFINRSDDDGRIVAGAQGFTNTLRLRHKTFLNVPSTRKPYGEEIRGLLTVKSDEFELLGSDVCGIEDQIKFHYMWDHDPEYVKEMSKPGYDPHLAICLVAGLMTQAEVDEYKDPNTTHERKAELALIRHAGKGTNYSSQYGAGAPTIARAAGVPEAIGEKLHQAYWEQNWSIKAIADQCTVKTSRGENWLWNPVASMWFHLKSDKDRFSTLVQGTASFLFDKWVGNMLETRPQINGQAHDECILEVRKGKRKQAEKFVVDAMEKVNKEYKLNAPLSVDVQFGDNYAEIH